MLKTLPLYALFLVLGCTGPSSSPGGADERADSAYTELDGGLAIEACGTSIPKPDGRRSIPEGPVTIRSATSSDDGTTLLMLDTTDGRRALATRLDASYWAPWIDVELTAIEQLGGTRLDDSEGFAAFLGDEIFDPDALGEVPAVEVGPLTLGAAPRCWQTWPHDGTECPPVGIVLYDLLVQGATIEPGQSAVVNGFAIGHQAIAVRDDSYGPSEGCADLWPITFQVDIAAQR